MHATHQCNAMIEAALKDVFLCSLYWAWITITVHLPLIPQCWENQWEWFKAIWTMVQRLCHHGMSALQELCFFSRSKGTSLPLHSMCMLLSIYSQPSITCGGFSSLRHALHHHCDITQNMRWLYLLWVTYMYLNSCIKHNCIFSSCLQLCFSWLLSLHQVSCGIAHVGSGICSFVAIQSL